MIFGDGVGASLVRGPYCEHGVGLWCDVDVFRAAEEGAWVGLKLDLREGTGFNLLRVQFWTPVQRKRPFIVANLLECLIQVEADFTSNSCG